MDFLFHTMTVENNAYPSPKIIIIFPNLFVLLKRNNMSDCKPLENADIVNVDISIYLNELKRNVLVKLMKKLII